MMNEGPMLTGRVPNFGTNAPQFIVIFCHAGKVCPGNLFLAYVGPDVRVRVIVVVIVVRKPGTSSGQPDTTCLITGQKRP